ncbi:MAG: HD domain-containing protein, partial [Planctomycetes bacterium]|nr:HD domain-containing protein [Planctomycetota bacterium]
SQATTFRPIVRLQDVFEEVRAELVELGLNMSVYDTDLQVVAPCGPEGDFCRAMCANCDRANKTARDLAERVITTASPGTMIAPWGCCFVGVAVLQRRRTVGAVVACFPVREMLDEEKLARTCGRLGLDRSVVEQYARRACRHSSDEANDFLRILGLLMSSRQSAATARDELATLSGNLSSTYEELNLLYRISGSTRVTHQPAQFLQNVCDELREVINSSFAAVVYSRPPEMDEDLVVTVADDQFDEQRVKALAETIVRPKLDQNEGPVVKNDFAANGAEAHHGLRNLMAVPLSTDETTIGMLMGFNKTDDFDTVDLKLLSSIGNQAAIFLANRRLYADLQDLLMGVLHALTASIDAKDRYTCGHSQRVAILAGKLAEQCEFPPDKVERIYLAGLLHDIGKIGVPEAVLCKSGKLTEEEFRIIKRHPSIGAGILAGIRQLDDLVPGILAHHERLDGMGYPQGLKGDELPVEGLIIGLADSFDAMTSDRTYRKALPIEMVIQEIKDNVGTQFRADIVGKLLAMNIDELMKTLNESSGTILPTGAIAKVSA